LCSLEDRADADVVRPFPRRAPACPGVVETPTIGRSPGSPGAATAGHPDRVDPVASRPPRVGGRMTMNGTPPEGICRRARPTRGLRGRRGPSPGAGPGAPRRWRLDRERKGSQTVGWHEVEPGLRHHPRRRSARKIRPFPNRAGNGGPRFAGRRALPSVHLSSTRASLAPEVSQPAWRAPAGPGGELPADVLFNVRSGSNRPGSRVREDLEDRVGISLSPASRISS